MRKLLALALACALALLCGCGEAAPEEPTAMDPNRPPAIMEPLQGGPMLYAFPGRNGKNGLINQDGDVVQKPIYSQDSFGYTYGFDGKTIGFVARTEDEIHFYTLDGEHRTLRLGWDDAFSLFGSNGGSVLPGGRYAAFTISSDHITDPVGIQHTTTEGLYDIQTEAWLFEPKRGREVRLMTDGATCFITDFAFVPITEEWIQGFVPLSAKKTAGENTRTDRDQPLVCWELDLRTGEAKERPPLPPPGYASEYYPNAGWYPHYVSGSDVSVPCDAITNEPIDLHGWTLRGDFFGEYAMVHRGTYPDFEFAFINRKLEVQPKHYWNQYYAPEKYGNGAGPAYMAKEKDGTEVLLDKDLKVLCTVGEGEELLFFNRLYLQGREWGEFILLDDKGQVRQYFGENGEAQPKKIQAYTHSSYGAREDYIRTHALLWDGKAWTSLYTDQFLPPEVAPQIEDPFIVDPWTRSRVRSQLVCPEFVILETGYESAVSDMETMYKVEELFAVDWQGNRIPNCPMLSFFQQSDTYFSNSYIGPTAAAPQGPNYHWVEQDGQRGYINTQGEWLFVE